jgi:hypothetical protein
MDLEQLISRAAEALSWPAALVRRSVVARARAQGQTPEQLAAEWAGVDASEVAAGAAPAPAEPVAVEAAAPPPAPVAEVAVEVVEAVEREEAEPAPEPEPEEEPEEVMVASAGIRETKRISLPRWLAASFVVVPLVAVLYTAANANGPGCGNGGALAIDPATGVAENCDGTEFGSLGGNPLKLGAALYSAEASPTCQSCHGTAGEGGTGPALAGGAVLETFPSCADHITWVALGTNRWRDEVGPTYGATNKAVGGVGIMQSYEDAGLTAEEIAAVVLFERVNFGGQDRAEAEAECLGDSGGEASG